MKSEIPIQKLEMKAEFYGFDLALFNELFEKTKNIHPNIK